MRAASASVSSASGRPYSTAFAHNGINMVSDNTLIWLGEILLFSIAMTPVFVDNGYYSTPAPRERQTHHRRIFRVFVDECAGCFLNSETASRRRSWRCAAIPTL